MPASRQAAIAAGLSERGYVIAPVTIDPDRITVSFNGKAVCVNGTGVDGARDVDLSGPDVAVLVDLGLGAETGSIRTTDLSHAYVEENSAYSS